MPTVHHKHIALWLFASCVMVVVMVWIGGVTRLSGSGLSMTDWHPIHGIIPPTSDTEWLEEFENYRASPEYQQINKGMSMGDFQRIFYVEYIHRIAGRITGFVFLLPFLFFLATKRIPPGYTVRFFGIFALGGLQGVIGWYMVKSGLVDVPAVSHYRLTLHLLTAFLLFSLLWHHAFLFKHHLPPARTETLPLTRHITVLLVLLVLQIAWGGFVAGLDAGLLYNTWPSMNGAILPDGMWFLEPTLRNVLDNHGTVQFVHRSLGIVIALGIVLLFIRAVLAHRVGRLPCRMMHLVAGALILAFIQFALGVFTLLLHVPLWLGSAHQLGALALLASLLSVRFYLLKTTQ